MGAIGGEDLPEVAGSRGEKILVSVRLRPLSEKEAARNDVSEWECISDNTIICRNNLAASERSMYPSAYTFDRVFRSDCSTRQVYEEGAKEVALSVVSGINSSIFAYGQTSSGKTYTMSGITEYTVADIYDYIDKHMDREFFLKFCAMEIYNESVRDLLSADSTPLRLLDDPERGTTVERLTEETLRDWSHFKELMCICEAQRQIGETSLNEASSRSHQILRLTIESSAREFLGNDKSSSLAATVNFVDLAGSERACQTLSAGTRLKEGCHINRSLLTLGTVIRKLSKGRNGHVPYRDSKLTRILQSSLGGNARTAIICTLSPEQSHIEQSRNTLLFASCANEVSTNARVNVVMSDKALVKQLQRELARLENELKSGGTVTVTSDSSSILKEKELQIGKLKKEIADVTQQRDLAQSQVKDLMRVVGDDKQLILVDVDQYYPKLKVCNSWDVGNQTPGEVIMTGSNSIANSSRSYDTSQNSDGFSRGSSHESFLHLADDDEDFLHTDSPQQLSVGNATPNFVKIHMPQEEINEQSNESSDDVCKDVRCIEMEEPNMKTHLVPKILDSSPDKHANSNASSPRVNTFASGLIVVGKGQKSTNEELKSIPPKKEKIQNTVPPSFLVPSPEKPSQWLMEKDLSGFACKTLTRSRSCKARVTTSLTSCWFENIDNYESTPPITLEKSFTGRPEGLRKNLSSLNFDNEVGSLSTNDFQTCENDAADEQNVNSSIDGKLTNKSIYAAKEPANLDSYKSLADSELPQTELEPKPAKSVKDVGLDPIQNEFGSPVNWPSEFMRFQREIIELWHSCNVSLIHRTYFFQLFKGDPSDSIYMEVELRRLSFLKETFSRGNQTVEDGRTLTLASSMKALSRERHMLAKQMQKRLTKNGRENIFLKWGIGLNTKHRRLQLVQRLWSDTKHIDHVTESAIIVSKLIGKEVPEQAFKEMFGLKFTARRPSRKSFGLKHSVMSLV